MATRSYERHLVADNDSDISSENNDSSENLNRNDQNDLRNENDLTVSANVEENSTQGTANNNASSGTGQLRNDSGGLMEELHLNCRGLWRQISEWRNGYVYRSVDDFIETIVSEYTTTHAEFHRRNKSFIRTLAQSYNVTETQFVDWYMNEIGMEETLMRARQFETRALLRRDIPLEAILHRLEREILKDFSLRVITPRNTIQEFLARYRSGRSHTLSSRIQQGQHPPFRRQLVSHGFYDNQHLLSEEIIDCSSQNIVASHRMTQSVPPLIAQSDARTIRNNVLTRICSTLLGNIRWDLLDPITNQIFSPNRCDASTMTNTTTTRYGNIADTYASSGRRQRRNIRRHGRLHQMYLDQMCRANENNNTSLSTAATNNNSSSISNDNLVSVNTPSTLSNHFGSVSSHISSLTTRYDNHIENSDQNYESQWVTEDDRSRFVANLINFTRYSYLHSTASTQQLQTRVSPLLTASDEGVNAIMVYLSNFQSERVRAHGISPHYYYNKIGISQPHCRPRISEDLFLASLCTCISLEDAVDDINNEQKSSSSNVATYRYNGYKFTMELDRLNQLEEAFTSEYFGCVGMRVDSQNRLVIQEDKHEKFERNLDIIIQLKEKNLQVDDFRCPICFDIYFKPVCTPCRHIFCAECMLGVLMRTSMCPMCRAPVYVNMLESLLDTKDEYLKMIFFVQQSLSVHCPECNWIGAVREWEAHVKNKECRLLKKKKLKSLRAVMAKKRKWNAAQHNSASNDIEIDDVDASRSNQSNNSTRIYDLTDANNVFEIATTSTRINRGIPNVPRRRPRVIPLPHGEINSESNSLSNPNEQTTSSTYSSSLNSTKQNSTNGSVIDISSPQGSNSMSSISMSGSTNMLNSVGPIVEASSNTLSAQQSASKKNTDYCKCENGNEANHICSNNSHISHKFSRKSTRSSGNIKKYKCSLNGEKSDLCQFFPQDTKCRSVVSSQGGVENDVDDDLLGKKYASAKTKHAQSDNEYNTNSRLIDSVNRNKNTKPKKLNYFAYINEKKALEKKNSNSKKSNELLKSTSACGTNTYPMKKKGTKSKNCSNNLKTENYTETLIAFLKRKKLGCCRRILVIAHRMENPAGALGGYLLGEKLSHSQAILEFRKPRSSSGKNKKNDNNDKISYLSLELFSNSNGISWSYSHCFQGLAPSAMEVLLYECERNKLKSSSSLSSDVNEEIQTVYFSDCSLLKLLEESKYENYSLLGWNCHNFVNRILRAACTYPEKFQKKIKIPRPLSYSSDLLFFLSDLLEYGAPPLVAPARNNSKKFTEWLKVRSSAFPNSKEVKSDALCSIFKKNQSEHLNDLPSEQNSKICMSEEHVFNINKNYSNGEAVAKRKIKAKVKNDNKHYSDYEAQKFSLNSEFIPINQSTLTVKGNDCFIRNPSTSTSVTDIKHNLNEKIYNKLDFAKEKSNLTCSGDNCTNLSTPATTDKQLGVETVGFHLYTNERAVLRNTRDENLLLFDEEKVNSTHLVEPCFNSDKKTCLENINVDRLPTKKEQYLVKCKSLCVCLYKGEDSHRMALKNVAKLLASGMCWFESQTSIYKKSSSGIYRPTLSPRQLELRYDTMPIILLELQSTLLNSEDADANFACEEIFLNKSLKYIWNHVGYLSLEYRSDNGLQWHFYPERPRGLYVPQLSATSNDGNMSVWNNNKIVSAGCNFSLHKLISFLESVRDKEYHPTKWSTWDFASSMLHYVAPEQAPHLLYWPIADVNDNISSI